MDRPRMTRRDDSLIGQIVAANVVLFALTLLAASIAAGLDLGRLLIVRCRTLADQLWAYEQALRAPECGAAFAWLAARPLL